MRHRRRRLLSAAMAAVMVLGCAGAVSAAQLGNGTVETGSGFEQAFSDPLEITSDQLVVTFKNTTNSSTAYADWCVPAYQIKSSADVEYITIRSDEYAWSGDWNTNVREKSYGSTNISSISDNCTDAWNAIGWAQANQNGQSYEVTASRSDGVVTYTISTTVNDYRVFSTTTCNVEDGVKVYLSLSGEQCTLSQITANGTSVSDVTCGTFWSAFSEGIEITADGEVAITFTSTTNEGYADSWNVPFVVLFSSDDGKVNGTDYVEYYLTRADYAGWGGYGSFTGQGAWEIWLAANEEGLDYTLTATKADNVITFTISDTFGVCSEWTIAMNSDETIYLRLSGEDCTLTDINYTYYVDESVSTFLGGSLRMTATGGSEYGDYDTTALRFGYTFTLPEDAELESWYWNWGTAADDLSGRVNGVNCSEEDGTYTSNLVITDIGRTDYDTTIYSQLTVGYTIDGISYSAIDEVQSRSVNQVATTISGRENAPSGEKEYVAGILGTN